MNNANSQQQQQQQQAPSGMELVLREMPTLKALIALNIGEGPEVETLAMQELEFLKMQADLKPQLKACLQQRNPIVAYSTLLGVKAVLKKNLTLDPQAGLVYIKMRGVNIGTQQQQQWVNIPEFQETANGLISVNRQCGRILDIERPKVKKDAAGKVVSVSVRYLVPSVPSPRWEEVEFDESDFEKWKTASHKENSRSWKADSGKEQPNAQTLNYANPNYTNFKGGIDPEFARAKAIRHGLKKLGTNPNEGRAKLILVDKKEVQIVQPEVAHAEAQEEYTGGSNEENVYIQYEETPVTNTHQQAPAQQQQNATAQQQQQGAQQKQQNNFSVASFDPNDL